MAIEYGAHMAVNHIKRQHEQLAQAVGEPIAILDCYDDGDIVAVTGTYQGMGHGNALVIETPHGISEQLTEPGSELLVGYEDIGGYVESAFELYENEGDVSAGLVAVSLVDKFNEYFPELPQEITDTIAHDLCGSSDHIDYLVAREASEAMASTVDTIMRRYIQHFRTPQEALSTKAVTAYLAACTDPDDGDAQLRYLLDCRTA